MDKLVKIKSAFFRPETTKKFLDRKTYYVLNKFGGSVRKTAQRSMRSKKGYQKSGTGKPPLAHGRKLLKKLLFYSMNKGAKTVVVGPLLLDETKKLGIPKLMETGGTVIAQTRKGSVKKDYKGNPFMKPAFDAFTGKVASWYKKS